MTRGVRGSGRETREQDLRENESVHEEEPISFEAQGPLPDIRAREGYAQRWIRVKKGAEDDAQNLYTAARKGWKPRSADTVPKHLQWMTVQREGMGGVIGTHDMVLMERPTSLNRREAEMKKQDRRNLEKAVKQNLFSEYRALNTDGFGAPTDESTARVERGRPIIQDD